MPQRSQIRFGYLFYSMRNTLCFSITIDGEDIWALEHKPDETGKLKWHGDTFCPTWWATDHPAEGSPPKVEELRTELANVVSLRFGRMLQTYGN